MDAETRLASLESELQRHSASPICFLLGMVALGKSAKQALGRLRALAFGRLVG